MDRSDAGRRSDLIYDFHVEYLNDYFGSAARTREHEAVSN
jgi:hypothetical protein